MKFVEFSRYGSPDKLRIIDVDKPEPNDNEVLVRIITSSINSWDWELLHAVPFVNRIMFGLFKPSRLKTLGIDIAGQVEKVGREVTGFCEGDEVYGDLSAVGMGGFAEYVAVPETALFRKPANISFEQAAAVPQAGLLALQGLNKAGIKAGQKVLINGASGGSGSMAVQIAKLYDTEITGVCRTEKIDFVRSLGVDHVIDYKAEDFTRNGQQYDLILDAQGKHSLLDYRRALSPTGVYVIHGGATSCIMQIMLLGPLLSLFSRRRLGVLLHKPNQAFDEMGELLSSGKVVPVIDKVFSLDEIVAALTYYGAGKTRGKVIIRM